ncbi:hypothetical protein KUTeg_014113 [Tegillarca granosa]|uniref:L-asparaginase N-terminal domain-containing protein n=1 Tax=Tegillarca granosa TaxID=220873 RepID=A0ABQ9EW22_TEGGR|nr:hypothetical protein KUTeg_014113 [Tegillarca granosa]
MHILIKVYNSCISTIDKEYPKTIKGYAFEIGEPAVKRILDRIKPGCSVNLKYVSVCRKDSQDITDEDRAKVADICSKMTYSKILITHGTDTMIETASFVARLVKDKTIVITGAFLPETFKNSDADFNVGLAIGALQSNTYPGVYIAIEWMRVPMVRM